MARFGLFLPFAFAVSSLEVTPFRVNHAQQPADSITTRARPAFDFLIGTWQVEMKTDSGGKTTPSIGETYRFEKSTNGTHIIGYWRFNRGTSDRPDFVDASYYSGYDNTRRMWSFYYVSPQSAQYWPGQQSEGRWHFYNEFTIDGRVVLQRQYWRRVDDRTLHRIIENSVDRGNSWKTWTSVLRRQWN